MRFDTMMSQSAGHDLRNRMAMLFTTGSERLFDVKLMKDRPMFDIYVHFAGELLILEGELSGATARTEAASMVRAMIARLSKTPNLQAFHRDAARQVRAITGFDRVMIYRFDPTGAGEVIAESTNSGVEGFLGLHYPASGIPQHARALYLGNPFRIIANVAAVPVPLLPEAKSAGRALDLSSAVTRPFRISGQHGRPRLAFAFDHRGWQAVGTDCLPPSCADPAQFRGPHRRRTVRRHVFDDAGKPPEARRGG